MRILLAVRESILWILKLFSERQGQNELRKSGSLCPLTPNLPFSWLFRSQLKCHLFREALPDQSKAGVSKLFWVKNQTVNVLSFVGILLCGNN